MSDAFAPNTVLQSVKGQEIRVDCLCAEGSSVAVYDVTVNGEKKLFRWFKHNPGQPWLEDCWQRTREKMEAGIPGRFVFWPEDMTELSENGFGYVTRPELKDSISFREALDGRYQFPSVRDRINVGLNLALACFQLHEKGYCLEESCTEFWFSTRTGGILFPETESIVRTGSSLQKIAGARYCAPEVAMQQSTVGVESDRYGLGLCLFLLLLGSHPLEGMRHLVPVLTPQVEHRLYVAEPLFLFDPENGENRPHPVLHKGVESRWNALPGYIRELFLRIFGSQGLQNPADRPTEGEWVAALCRMKTDKVSCTCGKDSFGWAMGATCSRCGKPVPKAARLTFPGFAMPLVRGRKVYRCFLGEENPLAMVQSVAVVVEDEQRPGSLRLKNTGEEWTAYTPSGAEKKVQREETVPLMPGITIFMGGVEVKIENP